MSLRNGLSAPAPGLTSQAFEDVLDILKTLEGMQRMSEILIEYPLLKELGASAITCSPTLQGELSERDRAIFISGYIGALTAIALLASSEVPDNPII